jgi:FKBP-type peptidyl-prolyl cis-trans isomerase SlyD
MVEQIQDGVIVEMSYLMTVDGQEVEHAPADDPMYYLHGSGAILPGLEDELAGKKVGDKLNVGIVMEPDIWEAPRDDFDHLPSDIKPGDEIDIYDDAGDMVRALVKAIDDEKIVLDLLDIEAWMVGKTATFKIEVLKIRQATEAELEVGEPEEYFEYFMDDNDDEYDPDGDDNDNVNSM